MSVVRMPRLSESMQEGTIQSWLVAEGTLVRVGDPIAEIETDKAILVYEAEDEGVLGILAAAGTTVKVGDPIAHIGGRGTDGDDLDDSEPSAAKRSSVADSPATASFRRGAATTTATASDDATDGSRVAASPVARRMAREHGLDLVAVAGANPGRRIGKSEILAAIAQSDPSPRGAGVPAVPVDLDARREPLTRIQRVIAQRMVHAKASIPEFTASMTVDAAPCTAVRAQLKARPGSLVPSINDLVVRAVALTLRDHPRLNAGAIQDEIEWHGRVHVGIAVASEEALHVPVIRDADRRSVIEIAAESRRLAELVQNGQIGPADLEGGTFTVSNLGMFGISRFTAIINAPQVAILAVGAAEPRDGGVRMELTLTCDHRIVYGAHAAAFLASLRTLLENPSTLVLAPDEPSVQP